MDRDERQRGACSTRTGSGNSRVLPMWTVTAAGRAALKMAVAAGIAIGKALPPSGPLPELRMRRAHRARTAVRPAALLGDANHLHMGSGEGRGDGGPLGVLLPNARLLRVE